MCFRILPLPSGSVEQERCLMRCDPWGKCDNAARRVRALRVGGIQS